MEELRYPIGRFSFDESAGSKQVDEWISDIDRLPESLTKAVISLTEEQLDTPYREDGWTIRQVVHHLADSHANALIRTKLLLTEDKPTIKPYDEKLWAKLRDNDLPVQPSLSMIKGIHERWVRVLEFVDDEDWNKQLYHPENGDMTLKHVTAQYAWHGNHHLAHITNLKDRKNW